jgi:hypothetical protein
MGVPETSQNSGSVAVWYFVGATFLFAGSTIFGTSGDGRGPLAVIGIVAGFAVLVVGLVVFGRELKGKGD